MMHAPSALTRVLVPSLIFSLLGAAGCAKAGPKPPEEKVELVQAERPAAEIRVEQTAPADGIPDLRTAIVQVAKQNVPAVVHIEVIERQEVENPFFSFENDPFFRRFFGVPEAPRRLRREQRGLGTGMLIDKQGHILTNHHVVGGATKINILLASGNEYPGKLVGTDPKTDLAVVKIEAKEALPHVTFGDSDQIEVGEWVVAIGHPRGLDQTVTQGIISAKHRRGITNPTSYEDFLQTDAAINPGNSGGPLLNLHGQVIGVNAAIASQSGGSEGIGFAIPSNMAIYVARQLIGTGKVERGWVGVQVQEVTPEIARSLGLPSAAGALVAEVSAGGPAERAGVKRGDVILSFRGQPVADAGALRNATASTPIGEVVKVSVWRKGKKEEVSVKVGDLQDAARATAGALRQRIGGTVRPVTAKEAQQYGLEADQGVALAEIDPKGPLALVGLEVSDLILEVAGRPVEGPDGLAELVGAVRPRQRVPMLVLDHRTGNTGYVQVAFR